MTGETANIPVPLDDQLCYAIYTAGIAIQQLYKPLLDELGLTYPQYLALNVLRHEDGCTVGAIAERLSLESSTLTPLLKRLETSGLVRRTRNPESERQVVVSLTDQGRALRLRAGCLGDALLDASGSNAGDLATLNKGVRALRTQIYKRTGGRDTSM
ncbi:MarR family transcriptional regulator [Mycoplana sp. MJR14]|uniref:MarR family winged helix-turn-helix transcriptional regulator n=1 Tax=Mycoplana sp. MJR14 TaxID=3032583 RepID=UPI000DD7A376|nr:MarR family transcriptional regulator [Mycoplana sp. MJR14]MDF1632876.1 MarR family transcriptional regulator [Mycoplana sp. MJR14]